MAALRADSAHVETMKAQMVTKHTQIEQASQESMERIKEKNATLHAHNAQLQRQMHDMGPQIQVRHPIVGVITHLAAPHPASGVRGHTLAVGPHALLQHLVSQSVTLAAPHQEWCEGPHTCCWAPCAASTLHTTEWHVSAAGLECTSAPPVGLGLIN